VPNIEVVVVSVAAAVSVEAVAVVLAAHQAVLA
jgi:hypothetical protein